MYMNARTGNRTWRKWRSCGNWWSCRRTRPQKELKLHPNGERLLELSSPLLSLLPWFSQMQPWSFSVRCSPTQTSDDPSVRILQMSKTFQCLMFILLWEYEDATPLIPVLVGNCPPYDILKIWPIAYLTFFFFLSKSLDGFTRSLTKKVLVLIVRNTYMVREHHVTVLPANQVSVLCMKLWVSGGSHTQYTYMIGPGAQPRGASGPCKYFSLIVEIEYMFMEDTKLLLWSASAVVGSLKLITNSINKSFVKLVFSQLFPFFLSPFFSYIGGKNIWINIWIHIPFHYFGSKRVIPFVLIAPILILYSKYKLSLTCTSMRSSCNN